MDTTEARIILDEIVRWYRGLSYTQLVALVGKYDGFVQVTAPSGTEYNLQTMIVWDDLQVRTNNIRAFVWIDDGNLYDRIGDDFIVDPQGHFIGE